MYESLGRVGHERRGAVSCWESSMSCRTNRVSSSLLTPVMKEGQLGGSQGG